MPKKIGLIVGREWSFPPAFIEAVKEHGSGVAAEYVRIGTPGAGDPSTYDVIVDRMSDEVPFYRSYLRQVALQGTRVIDNPFLLDGFDHFTAMALATDIGLEAPAAELLPHRDYAPDIVHEESLRNLDYPLDWSGAIERIGTPFLLREATRGPSSESYVCHSLEELLRHYNHSGRRLMMIQARTEWEHYVRCLVIGGEVLALKYDPAERKYQVHHEHLSAELGDRLVRDSLAFCDAAGLDLNAIDWAIRDGVHQAVELLNPVPDFDVYALSSHYFERVVDLVAKLAIELAENPAASRASQRIAWRATAGGGQRPSGSRTGDGAGDLAEEIGGLAKDLPRSEL